MFLLPCAYFMDTFSWYKSVLSALVNLAVWLNFLQLLNSSLASWAILSKTHCQTFKAIQKSWTICSHGVLVYMTYSHIPLLHCHIQCCILISTWKSSYAGMFCKGWLMNIALILGTVLDRSLIKCAIYYLDSNITVLRNHNCFTYFYMIANNFVKNITIVFPYLQFITSTVWLWGL